MYRPKDAKGEVNSKVQRPKLRCACLLALRCIALCFVGSNCVKLGLVAITYVRNIAPCKLGCELRVICLELRKLREMFVLWVAFS